MPLTMFINPVKFIRMKLFQISFQIIFQIRKSKLKFKMWQEMHTYSKKESETLQ